MRAYAIRGGKEGKERLNLLARVMLPTTSQLLKTVGFRRGMNCLDVGCGGGHVTLFMARSTPSFERDLPDKLFSINCRSVLPAVFVCRLFKLTM
jgi:hypothetical protein